MTDGGNRSRISRTRRRFRFGLTGLLLIVVLFAYWWLAVWLGRAAMLFVILAVGPIGGTMIVRLSRSKRDWALTFWSGVVTTLLWAGVSSWMGVSAKLSGADTSSSFLGPLVFGIAFWTCIPAFIFGLLTGFVWEVGFGAIRDSWQSLARRSRRILRPFKK